MNFFNFAMDTLKIKNSVNVDRRNIQEITLDILKNVSFTYRWLFDNLNKIYLMHYEGDQRNHNGWTSENRSV